MKKYFLIIILFFCCSNFLFAQLAKSSPSESGWSYEEIQAQLDNVNTSTTTTDCYSILFSIMKILSVDAHTMTDEQTADVMEQVDSLFKETMVNDVESIDIQDHSDAVARLVDLIKFFVSGIIGGKVSPDYQTDYVLEQIDLLFNDTLAYEIKSINPSFDDAFPRLGELMKLFETGIIGSKYVSWNEQVFQMLKDKLIDFLEWEIDCLNPSDPDFFNDFFNDFCVAMHLISGFVEYDDHSSKIRDFINYVKTKFMESIEQGIENLSACGSAELVKLDNAAYQLKNGWKCDGYPLWWSGPTQLVIGRAYASWLNCYINSLIEKDCSVLMFEQLNNLKDEFRNSNFPGSSELKEILRTLPSNEFDEIFQEFDNIESSCNPMLYFDSEVEYDMESFAKAELHVIGGVPLGKIGENKYCGFGSFEFIKMEIQNYVYGCSVINILRPNGEIDAEVFFEKDGNRLKFDHLKVFPCSWEGFTLVCPDPPNPPMTWPTYGLYAMAFWDLYEDVIDLSEPIQDWYRITGFSNLQDNSDGIAEIKTTYSRVKLHTEHTTYRITGLNFNKLIYDVQPVSPNESPIADANSDQTLKADADGIAAVTLNGANSSDTGSSKGINSHIAQFEWFKQWVKIAEGEIAQIRLGVGEHEITLVVTDDEGATGKDKIIVTVIEPEPNAPVISDIPDHTIPSGESFISIKLNDYVSDANNTDAEMTWSHSGNSDLIVSIVNRVATITIPYKNWYGAETIVFTATDPDNFFDSDDVVISVPQMVILAGDIDNSGAVDLKDAILALQVNTKMSISSDIYSGADINGDKKIGIEEGIYALQIIAGIRLQ